MIFPISQWQKMLGTFLRGDAMSIEKLVGLKWGEVDCFSLCMKAHKEILGHSLQIAADLNVTDDDIVERSNEILARINEYADEVTTPTIGDIGLMRQCGGIHVYTFVEPHLILHIRRGGRSSLHRWSDAIKRHTIGYYRWR